MQMLKPKGHFLLVSHSKGMRCVYTDGYTEGSRGNLCLGHLLGWHKEWRNDLPSALVEQYTQYINSNKLQNNPPHEETYDNILILFCI